MMLRPNKLYRTLLLLYPRMYRQDYGEQIAQTFDDMVQGEGNRAKKVWLILKEYLTLPGNVIEQYVAEASLRGGLSDQTLLAILSMVLLIPFVVALTADELSERLYHAHPFQDWLWSPLVIFIWLIVLPGIGLFVSLAAYVIFILRKSIQQSKLTLQFERAWALLLVIFLSAGLLFAVLYRDGLSCLQHDQKRPTKLVQCIASNLTSRDRE